MLIRIWRWLTKSLSSFLFDGEPKSPFGKTSGAGGCHVKGVFIRMHGNGEKENE